MKHVLAKVVYMDFTLCSVFMANSRLAKLVLVKFATRPRLWAALCKTTNKQ
jgi:hypothetical protein